MYLMDCQYHQHFFTHVHAFSVRICLGCHNRNVRARDRRNVIMSGTWREVSFMNGTDSRNVSALTSLRHAEP